MEHEKLGGTMPRWRRALERLAVSLVIVTAGAAAAATPVAAKRPDAPQSRQATASPDPFASEQLGRDRTVFIVMSLECLGLGPSGASAAGQPAQGTCRDSVLFYKKLLALPKMDGAERRLVVIVTRGVAPAARELTALGLKPHAVESGPAVKTGVVFHPIADDLFKEHPTLLVLDGRGRRIGTWPGRLTATQEQAVIAAISGATGR